MKKKSDASKVILKKIRRLKLAVGKTVEWYHSDNAKSKQTTGLLNELESKGTAVLSTETHSSEQNAYVERQFGSLFAATRAALASSELSKKYWSLACLYTIYKGNFIPIKRNDGKFKAPQESIKLRTLKPDIFLPFGKEGLVIDATPMKKKLLDLALKARYLKCTQPGQYLVLLKDTDRTRLIRMEEFLLPSEEASKTKVALLCPQGESAKALKEEIFTTQRVAFAVKALQILNGMSRDSENWIRLRMGPRMELKNKPSYCWAESLDLERPSTSRQTITLCHDIPI